ncbi:MAG: toprim domain-containing protein [Terriglobia bacterium]|jgi:DNA primase
MILPWVDFKAVKAAVSVEMALAYYGVMLRRGHRPYLRGRCPLPGHASKSSHQSFIVNTEKNAWACHSASCGASRNGRTGGNVLDFVAAMERCSLRDAALKLQDRFTVTSPPSLTARVVSLGDVRSSALAVSEESNKPLAFTLRDIDQRHPYLAERGVDLNSATYFGIGFYPGKGCMEGRIVIPIHNEHGVLVAYAGRIPGMGEPKYRFPRRFRKSLVLFNLHRAVGHGRTAVLVEGFFDCIKVHQAGFPCVVALMGSSLSSVQECLLQQHFREVILMLDGDKPGCQASETIAARLVTRLSVRVVATPPALQPDQMSADQIHCLCDPDFF